MCHVALIPRMVQIFAGIFLKVEFCAFVEKKPGGGIRTFKTG